MNFAFNIIYDIHGKKQNLHIAIVNSFIASQTQKH